MRAHFPGQNGIRSQPKDVAAEIDILVFSFEAPITVEERLDLPPTVKPVLIDNDEPAGTAEHVLSTDGVPAETAMFCLSREQLGRVTEGRQGGCLLDPFKDRPAKFRCRFHYRSSPERKPRWQAREQLQHKPKLEQIRLRGDYDRHLPFAFRRLQCWGTTTRSTS
jgi:hypothetical protein